MSTFGSESFLPFCQRLYAELRGECEKENCFISPLSIYSALSLALAGSSGKTYDELMSVLALAKGDLSSTIAHVGKELSGVAAGDKDKTLVQANGLFLDSKFTVESAFKSLLERHLSAEPHTLNFSFDAEGARKEINNWVLKNTGNKIEDLMPSGSIDHQTRLVLANAIYFKGTWKKVFHRDCTMETPFYTLDGGEVNVQMMKDNGDYETADFPDLEASACRIPFRCHEMLLVIPYKNDGLPSVLQKITSPGGHKAFGELFDKSKYFRGRIDLFLPRFKLGGGESVDLKEPLGKMGVGTLFSESQADLSKINRNEQLYVSKMVHKAMIEVNEEGAEAAAATGMSIMAMCLPPQFRADHPFLFFIVTETGVPAFMGHVVNPLK